MKLLKCSLKLLLTQLILMNMYMGANNLRIVQRAVQKYAAAYVNFADIETERLCIRKLTMTDVDEVLVFTSDPREVQYTALFGVMKTKEEVEKYIAEIVNNYPKGAPELLAISLKDSKKVVGLIALDVESISRADIMYAVAPDYWGKGIATEAARAMLKFGFKILGLNRIQGVCDPRNVASARVLEKCGMLYEGLLRSYFLIQKEGCDRKLYAITAKDYELQKR
jgi:[ribosomal protein S5]-alanine N-acetyltransferase